MQAYKAKKSLGQNFLKSKPALRKIIEAGEIRKDDVILEIGPGKGKLTSKLLEKSNCVIAVEKDRELFEFLKTKFEKEIKNRKLILIEDDCLNFNPKDYNLKPGTYKLISNIPYNITGAILKKFLTDNNQPERMVLLLQQEVAQRIVARNPRYGGAGGKESILSISVKAYGEPKMIMKVPARYFSPAPKVDSAVIAIKNISRKNFVNSPEFEEKFWEIVKTGFAHKRKKLSGNLKNLISFENPNFSKFKDARAEDLSLEDWITLAKN